MFPELTACPTVVRILTSRKRVECWKRRTIIDRVNSITTHLSADLAVDRLDYPHWKQIITPSPFSNSGLCAMTALNRIEAYQLTAQPETRTPPFLLIAELPHSFLPIPVMGNHQSRTRSDNSMDHQQEETRKRRSRVLSGATAVVTPETMMEGTVDDAEGRDGPTTMERPRRTTRVLSHIKDGFRRSGSSRSIAVRPSTNARNPSMQGSTSAITEQEVAGEMSAQVGNQASRQDKKRRRIGEYAGPSDSGSSTDVSASTSQILGESLAFPFKPMLNAFRSSSTTRKYLVPPLTKTPDPDPATPLPTSRTAHDFRSVIGRPPSKPRSDPIGVGR